MASHEGVKSTLSKIGQQGHSERLCIITNISHLIQRGVEWMKDKDHAVFGIFISIKLRERT